MKKPLILLHAIFILSIHSFSQIDAGRMNEVFRQEILAAASDNLSDPWEITYGPDDSLWITEAKGYKIKKMHPNGGPMRTILDISFNSTFLTLSERPFNAQYDIGSNNPQGGLMGLAVHPKFLDDVNPKNYVYIAYVHDYIQTLPTNDGVIYSNRLVRFYYDTLTGRLRSPVSLCDTLPGSNDHNSGRLIIAPYGDSMSLFYAQGDMGAGQFSNADRPIKAQHVGSYEGKILRFNLEPDADAGNNRWIPSAGGLNSNPYNGVAQPQSAVWSMGIRNNQGFAYANGKLYGSSHGPFSDDEINILQSGKNFGHPIVIGTSTDGNYNSAKAGGSASSLPLISTEAASVTSIGVTNYRDPLMSFYAPVAGSSGTPGTIQYIYSQFNGGNYDNSAWPSEGLSGMDIYTKSLIPGWKNSLLVGCLKGGRIMKIRLNAAGDATLPNGNIGDTCTLFRSVNRFRDIALSPDGRSLFAVIDSSSTTSGPTTTNPIISACRGCVQKYTFLGYNAKTASPFASTIPDTIAIAAGLPNDCDYANTVTINAANFNNNIWVPITDTSSNIVAEIKANNNNLGTVTTSIYRHSGATRREDGGKRMYLDRNITITPQTQPGSAVSIRLYITAAEFNSLNTAVNSVGQPSGLGGSISNLGIFKNSSNGCPATLSGSAAPVTTTTLKTNHDDLGYVLQADITSFSTFFFANSSLSVLPAQLLSFAGILDNNTTLLDWITSSEVNTANFEIERSVDGSNYDKIGTVSASGNSNNGINYSFADNDVADQASPVIYYRLKMIDVDGNYAYSNVISVSLTDIAGKVTIFPNPVAAELRLTMAALMDGKAEWKIIDNAGRVVLQNVSLLNKGNNSVVINVDKLAAGLYYLSVSGAGIDQKVKLQKL